MIDWLKRNLPRPAALTTMHGADAGPSVLDVYVASAPSPANAIGIFEKEWASKLPGPLAGVAAGSALLFQDPRIEWALEVIGGVAGRRVLELGPLEAGHTYMLDRAGAREIVSVEANTRAFLKCLVVKELLGLPAARFLCGNFVEFLRSTDERFDVVLGSGVLYHLVNPVEVLRLMCRASDRVVLWTHYYDAAVLGANRSTAHRVVPAQRADDAGFAYEFYRHDYGRALNHPGFCGGSRPYAHWLTRDTILAALRHHGLSNIQTAFEQPDHPNGPAFSVVASRPTG